MERVKLWLLPVYVTVGLLVILIAAPTSRWVVLTQWDVIAGRWKYLAGNNGTPYPGLAYLEPMQRGLDESDLANDETAGFLRGLAPSRNMDMNEQDDRFFRLYDICKAKGDVRYWAQFIRVTSPWAQMPRAEAPWLPFPNRPQIQTRLRDACLAGLRLEPGNAFFPTMLAGVLYRTGDSVGSRKALLTAASGTRYDDYINFELQLRNDYLTSHYGNRGHQLTAYINANLMLPELNVVQSLARHFAADHDLEGRVAMIKICALAMTNQTSAIEVISSRSAMTVSLFQDPKTPVQDLQSPEKTNQAWADLMTRAPKTEGLARARQVYESMLPSSSNWPISPDAVQVILNLRPGFSAWSMWALALLIPGLGFVWLLSRGSWLATAAPFVAWLAPVCAFAAFDNLINVPWLPLSLVATAIAAWVRWRVKSVPPVVTIIVLVAACVFGAACWVTASCRLGFGSGILFGGMATFGAFALVPVKGEFKLPIAAGLACLLLTPWYCVMVARDLTADRQLAVVSTRLLNDASDVVKPNR